MNSGTARPVIAFVRKLAYISDALKVDARATWIDQLLGEAVFTL